MQHRTATTTHSVKACNDIEIVVGRRENKQCRSLYFPSVAACFTAGYSVDLWASSRRWKGTSCRLLSSPSSSRRCTEHASSLLYQLVYSARTRRKKGHCIVPVGYHLEGRNALALVRSCPRSRFSFQMLCFSDPALKCTTV